MNKNDVYSWQNTFHAADRIRREDAYLAEDGTPLFCLRGQFGGCRLFARRPHAVRVLGDNGRSLIHVFCSDEHAREFLAFVEGRL